MAEPEREEEALLPLPVVLLPPEERLPLAALLPPEAVRPVPGIPETLEILRQGGGHHYLVTHRDGLARAYLRIHGVWEDHIHMVRLADDPV